MPVYGLPLSLEASLNSLVELRPPTSWRVSGHGDEVTVVLRWTLSGSPSSDKTLDYDMDHRPRSSGQIGTSNMWARGIKRTEKQSPGAEIKTRCSSVHDCRLSSFIQPKYDCLQPFKLRKLDTISQFSPDPVSLVPDPASSVPDQASSVPGPDSPVPLFLTVADGMFQSPSPGAKTKCQPLACGNVETQQHEHRPQQQAVCDSQRKQKTVTQGAHVTPQNPSPAAHTEILKVICKYMSPCRSDVSPDRNSVTLDEKTGLFLNTKHLLDEDVDGKDNSSKVNRPVMSDPMQNDSGCASESNSTSLSHYVKHTLSQDSSSQDGSRYKSASMPRSNQTSPSDHRCSSAGSSVSLSSVALQSCSSKTKVGSVDSSNDNTNLMDEKDDDCRSQDLDMVCSNEADNEQTQVGSVSSRSSISNWDSFDSFQSDLLAGEVEASDEINRQVTNDCL